MSIIELILQSGEDYKIKNLYKVLEAFGLRVVDYISPQELKRISLILPMILLMVGIIGMTNCSSIVKTVYVKQELPYIPVKPDYYGVTFYEIEKRYCLDEDKAKNLLKNRILDLGYMEELRKILEGLK